MVSVGNVSCDSKILLKQKENFYKTAIRPTLLRVIECWVVKQQYAQMSITVIRMLQWMDDHIRKR